MRLSPILRRAQGERLTWWCPGCDSAHQITDRAGPHPCWTWNGDAERPTFSPSVLVTWTEFDVNKVCHSFVVDGQMQFLGDCTHELAGKTIPIPLFPGDWEECY